MNYKTINIDQTKELLTNPTSILVDIRDTDSYNLQHAEGAINLTEESYSDFVQNTDKASPILVMCYFGNSSQIIAQNLSKKGFEDVYSIEGGYDAWIKNA